MFAKVFKGSKDKKSSKSTNKVSEKSIQQTGEAITRLRDTEDMLLKKQKYLEVKIEKELATARANGTKNKREALNALKRKKRYEKTLQQIDGTLSTIELQREALEGANTNTAVLQTMSAGAQALKKVHKNMDVDQVDDMMAEIDDQMGIANEMSDAISRPTAFGQDFDEDDLLRELEELEQEDLNEQLLDVSISSPTRTKFPSPPSSALPTEENNNKSKRRTGQRQDDDGDMRALASWAT